MWVKSYLKTDLNPGCLTESHLEVFNIPQRIQTRGSPLLRPGMLCPLRMLSTQETGRLDLNFLQFLVILKCEIVLMDSICEFRYNAISMRVILA